jgi:hypothetical protein
LSGLVREIATASGSPLISNVALAGVNFAPSLTYAVNATGILLHTGLGRAVATDGVRAVIGSAWDDGEGTDRGAAHVLGPDGQGTWREIKKLHASDARDDDLFGYTVAVDGDYVVAGAAWARGGGTERGQAYLFARNEGGADNWGEVQRLRASDGWNGDWFGTSLALDGLYLLVGATGEDGDGQDRGAAYLFKKF